jgi:hypothetical protein
LAASPPKQIHELVDRKTGFRDDVAKCACSDLPVIGRYGSPGRCVSPQDHVTAGLPPEYEACALQSPADVSAGQVRRQLRH